MTDFPLFQMQKRPVLLRLSLYRRAVLGLFALFMLFGNFSRLLGLGHFPSNISVLEVGLYLVALPAYLMRLRKSHLLIVGILLSSLYGALTQGFDVMSSLYALKLIGMIGSGIVIGELFRSEEQLTAFFLRVFQGVLILGVVIFVTFSKADVFFALLKGYGIRFHGDPHMRRFISPFFDPNYYAAIACIPVVLAWHVRRYGFLVLVLASIALTFSRSGITTCGLVLIAMILQQRSRLSRWGFALLSFLLIPLGFPKEIDHLARRTLHLVDDPSARARLETFQAALAFFWERPFFGTGYHYLSKNFEEAFGRLSPDSSVLITLIDFGLIPTLVLLFVALWWSVNHFQRQGLFFLFYIYVAICILLTSLLNNLLYYPYWFIPVVALLTRMGGDQHGSSSSSRLAYPHGGSRKGLGSSGGAIQRTDLYAHQR